MLVTHIAVPIQSPSWFLGSLMYFNREPDAEVRCKSSLEPELMSEVYTWRQWDCEVSFTVVVNTIKPKTKRECSRTWVCKERLLDGDTKKRQCVLSLSDKNKKHQLAGVSVDLLIQVLFVFLCLSLQKSCDRYSTPQNKFNTELSQQMYFLSVKS